MIDNLSQNVKRGIRQKLRRGEYPGPAPLGYINNFRTRTIEPHPEQFEKVKKLLEMYASGDYSFTDLRNEAFKMGVQTKYKTKISMETIRRTLKKTFYYGVFKYSGEMHKGTYKPMITKETHDRIQEVMNKKARAEYIPNEKFGLKGIARCAECGSPITAEEHTKKKSGKTYRYYRCTKRRQRCDQDYIREEDLSKQVEEKVSSLALCDDWSDKILQQFDIWQGEERQSSRKALEVLETQLESTQAKNGKLLDLQLDNSIDHDEYSSMKAKLISEKLDTEEELRKIREDGTRWFELSKTFIKRSNEAQKILESKNQKQMKNFIQSVSSNSTILDRKLNVDLLEPWSFLIKHPNLTHSHSSQSFAFESSENQKAIAEWVGNKETPQRGQPLKGSDTHTTVKWLQLRCGKGTSIT